MDRTIYLFIVSIIIIDYLWLKLYTQFYSFQRW